AGDAERISGFLGSISQVERVAAAEAPGAPWILDVRPASAGRQVREAVLAGAARDGLGLTAIRSTEPSLDDIYRSALREAGLHRQAEPAEPAGPAEAVA